MALDSETFDRPAAFLEKVFSFDSMKEDDFVEFAYDRLARIAGDAAGWRRDWLREFLLAVSPSERSRALQKLLDPQALDQRGR